LPSDGLNTKAACNKCSNTGENWVCLKCFEVNFRIFFLKVSFVTSVKVTFVKFNNRIKAATFFYILRILRVLYFYTNNFLGCLLFFILSILTLKLFLHHWRLIFRKKYFCPQNFFLIRKYSPQKYQHIFTIA